MSQINIEEMIRKYGEEEVSRLMNKIKNNEIMLKLQKQISEMEEIVKEKRRQREKEQREKQKEEEENDR